MKFQDLKKDLENGSFVRNRLWPESVFIYLEPEKIKRHEDLKGMDLKAAFLSSKLNKNEEKYCDRKFHLHYRMKKEDGTIFPGWKPSSEELISNDWEIIQ